jgi:FdhE protein
VNKVQPMATTATVRVMTPEEIAAQAGGETPFLQWPDRRTVFAEREMRLRQLAGGHAMRDFLLFMADLAHAQHELLQRYPAVALPGAEAIDHAAKMGLPPLPAEDWPRDPRWREGLRSMLDAVAPRVPEGARPVVERLRNTGGQVIEAQADALLGGTMAGMDIAAAPLIGAALQVYWMQMVGEVRSAHDAGGQPFGRIDDKTVCPCCASRPTASITRAAGGATGQRYLHCSLCGTQWHMGRTQCAHCLSTKSIAFQSLQRADAEAGADADAGAARAAVQAETCDDCGHYLKVMYGDRDPQVDPIADDLATLTLDLLVAESGKQRHGVNLMLLFGDPDAPPPGAG